MLPFALFKAVAVAQEEEPEEQPTFFVDATGGSDSNDGLSEGTAWQTLSKVQSYADTTHFTAGDFVGFKGGETFDGVLNFGLGDITGTTALSPFKLGKYGTGYPTLRATGGSTTTRTALIKIDRCSHVVMQDMNLRVTAGSAGTVSCGIWLNNSTTSIEYEDVLIQRCDFQGFYSTARSDAATIGGHVTIVAQSSLGWNDIKVYDCRMHGASTTANDLAGIASYTGAGRIIRNVHYRGNHTWNMGTADVVNNHASGILVNGTTDGIAEHNLAHDIGANWTNCGGPVGIWAHNSDSAILRYNEVFHVRPTSYTAGCDWNGLGLDGAAGNCVNCIVEHNYSHDNGGSGFYHWASAGGANNTFQNNFSARNNTNEQQGHGEMSVNGQNGTTAGGGLLIQDNEFYAQQSGSGQGGCLVFQGISAGFPSSGTISGNIFSAESGAFGIALVLRANANSYTLLDNITYSNNVWNVRSGSFQVNGYGGGGVGNNYSSHAAWIVDSGETGGSQTAGGSIPTEPTFGLLDVDTGVDPHIAISAVSITEGAAQGTAIGTLSIVNSPGGVFTYSILNSAMSRVQVTGVTLECGSVATSSVDPGFIVAAVTATNGTVTLTRYMKLTVV